MERSHVSLSAGARCVTELAVDHVGPMRFDPHCMSSGRPGAWTMQPHVSTSSLSRTDAPIPMEQRTWEHISGLQRVVEASYPVAKHLTNLLRHHPELREEDGAVEWNQLLFQFQRSHFPKMSADGGRENRLFAFREAATRQYLCKCSVGVSQYMRSLQGHSGGVRVDPKLQSNGRVSYADGLITSITLGQHSIAALSPMLFTRSRNRLPPSSRQWTLCTSTARFHRMKLMNQGWPHTKQMGDAIRTQHVGSIWSSREAKDLYLGKRFPMP